MKLYNRNGPEESNVDKPMNLAAPKDKSKYSTFDECSPKMEMILEDDFSQTLLGSNQTASHEVNFILQSSDQTNVIVEPLERVIINPSTPPIHTGIFSSPIQTSPTLSSLALEETYLIKPVLTSHNILNMRNPQQSWDPQQSALLQLAAVAERKQAEEDEMMDIGCTTPTPGSPSATPQPICIREQPTSTTNFDFSHKMLNHPESSSHHSSSILKHTLTQAQSLPPMLNAEFDMPSSSGPLSFTPVASPFSARHYKNMPAPTASPDSAIHSTVYSPSQSPIQSRHGPSSGFSSPFYSSYRTTPSLSRNSSDASQYGESPYSYSSAASPKSPPCFSPSNSPVTSSRYSHHPGYISPALPSSPLPRGSLTSPPLYSHGVILSRHDEDPSRKGEDVLADLAQHSALTTQTGISRQQLINSPCPICADKISGFHYGIFSCESCKGFFKRTVQNKKNYVCLRGAECPVSIGTRKKCPACRLSKCLKMGMKLEAIREDRTRGGRSTYQCSYTIPAGLSGNTSQPLPGIREYRTDKEEPAPPPAVPILLQEIMKVEHLWCSPKAATSPDTNLKAEVKPQRGIVSPPSGSSYPGPGGTSSSHVGKESADPRASFQQEDDLVQTLTMMADQRLYKLVKWCKSLPLFKNILIDDQISLLINAWCELLVLSCCYRSMPHPGVIRVSNQVTLSIETARQHGIENCVEKMINFSDQLRRLKVDHYEYVSMKVVVLLTSDASGLKDSGCVRASQEAVVRSLQDYTVSHYPDMPSKFGELLLRMPELQRVCQKCSASTSSQDRRVRLQDSTS